MAKAKTSSFWLTETIDITAGGHANAIQGTIDLGAYVDVADRQAISVEQVDFIFQSHDTANATYSSAIGNVYTTNATVSVQITDLNRGVALVRADDRALVGSGALHLESAVVAGTTHNTLTVAADLYPDSYGKGSDSRLTVNDQLYLTGMTTGTFAANFALTVVCRLKCKVVSLTQKDWMAIAIQATAADN